ncbi:MAG: hypothetical protein ACOY94_13115 [Bacillota bacterium]
MRLIRLNEAARMLGVDGDTLRRRAKSGDTVEIYGVRLRVYRMDPKPNAERRFDADEIRAALDRLQRVR